MLDLNIKFQQGNDLFVLDQSLLLVIRQSLCVRSAFLSSNDKISLCYILTSFSLMWRSLSVRSKFSFSEMRGPFCVRSEHLSPTCEDLFVLDPITFIERKWSFCDRLEFVIWITTISVCYIGVAFSRWWSLCVRSKSLFSTNISLC